MNPLAPYLLLIQPIGGKARVEYHNEKENVLFEGGRVDAKRFLKSKETEIGWENIPQFNQPEIKARLAKRGIIPELRQIYTP